MASTLAGEARSAPLAFAPGPLARGVRVFWALDAEGVAPKRAVPDGCVDIVFHFSPSSSLPRAAVLGPMSRPRDIPPERIERIGFSLVPGEALPIVGAPLCELKDRVADLRDLWGRDADVLFEELAALPTQAARVARLTQALRQRWERSHADANTRLVRAAVETVTHRAVTTVDALAISLGTSERRLERAFRERVGLSPKVFTRIARLNRILARVDRGAPLAWAQLASELEFADQAHLIHEFRALTGESPRSFQRAEVVSGFYNLDGD